MMEHPIIFNSEEVKAILEGRKTQTRRVVKMQGSGIEDWYHRPDGLWQALHLPKGKGVGIGNPIKCPYGKVGDRLWVKETWCRGKVTCGELADGGNSELFVDQCVGDNDFIYKEQVIKENIDIEEVKWLSSIHMPRWASRITLEITNIRVERLQEISEDDIKKEGILNSEKPFIMDGKNITRRAGFIELWNSLAKKGFKWNDNPFVWVISFRRVER